jgi:hypothetical protein
MINAMPKLLRAVRLDDSDEHVFRACGAARYGEWVTTGGFAACRFETAPRCDPPCHCQSSFLAVGSTARASIAEVADASDEEAEEFADALAWHFVKAWGAPSWEVARIAAEDELRHIDDVCVTLAAGVWITVKRWRDDAGALEEQYAVYDRLMIGAHPL